MFDINIIGKCKMMPFTNNQIYYHYAVTLGSVILIDVTFATWFKRGSILLPNHHGTPAPASQAAH